MGSAAFITARAPARTPPRVRAQGARVWDAGGNVRIDLDMGGGSILLGHACPEVEHAAAEASLGVDAAAGALAALCPAAEAVRFTADEAQGLPAAIAAARRATGRRRVLACAPHTGPFGELTDVAAVIIDPLGAEPAQLMAARELADGARAVLIFDEAVSSLRVHEQGAEGLSGVRPDLSVHGAALANGRPLGAVAGRADLIAALDEADLAPARPASLAACAATLDILARAPVAPLLRVLGAELEAEVARLIEASAAAPFFALEGDPTLPAPLFCAPQLEGFWLRAMAEHGFIVTGPHAFSAAHGEAEVAGLIEAYTSILPALVAKGLLESLLRRPPQPITGRP